MQIFDRVASGGAEHVSVGNVTIQFTTDRVPVVDNLDEGTLSKFAELSDFERETLLSVGRYSAPEDACKIEGFEAALRSGNAESNEFFAKRVQNIVPYREYIGSLHRLEELNFLRSSQRALRDNEPYCADGNGLIFRLTDEGTRVRKYYLDLTAQTIAFSKRDISQD